jgi:hypothetical protein
MVGTLVQNITLDHAAIVRLEFLREKLVSFIKISAAAKATRAGRSTLTVDDIDAAWDNVVANKTDGRDISAAGLAISVDSFDNSALDRVCQLKRAFEEIVKRKAIDNAVDRYAQARIVADTTENPFESHPQDDIVVSASDIDQAWDEMTFGTRKELTVSSLLSP